MNELILFGPAVLQREILSKTTHKNSYDTEILTVKFSSPVF